MSRINQIQNIVNNRIEELTDTSLRQKAYIHSYGVSQICALLAVRRGANPHIAYTAGLLHDIYAYEAGTYDDHCAKGAKLAKEILMNMGTDVFTINEIAIIETAITNHDTRGELHGLYDEILKDADIMQPYFNSLSVPTSAEARKRFDDVFEELTLNLKLCKE